MWCKRIIPCLDVKNGRVVKGTKFVSLRDVGDPVALAKFYYDQGADELVFLDISASIEGKKTILDVARSVAKEIFIPFTIGGGIRSMDDIEVLLKAGADKVSIGTAGVENPDLIKSAATRFGSQAIVVSIDAKKQGNNWKVYTKSASSNSNLDAIAWAKKAEELGAGEILLNLIDCDGTKKGFGIELTKVIADAVSIPVIASGGAGSKEDFLEVFKKTKVSAALAASIFHYGEIRISELKKYLNENGVDIREV
ncbi:MAG: imidazole glycerol phosphate synthase subunit HisF [Candidatus Micrarchaeota archaeon]|nr:imidazole glycerol phosphate synthase subunit HisF [Candidatus Micrarchaeota archaeon]MBU1887398.1 imidazole glycerol phosphate synthase subunit HisF [Candidatus Micrarchaeota archaeon]